MPGRGETFLCARSLEGVPCVKLAVQNRCETLSLSSLKIVGLQGRTKLGNERRTVGVECRGQKDSRPDPIRRSFRDGSASAATGASRSFAPTVAEGHAQGMDVPGDRACCWKSGGRRGRGARAERRPEWPRRSGARTGRRRRGRGQERAEAGRGVGRRPARPRAARSGRSSPFSPSRLRALAETEPARSAPGDGGAGIAARPPAPPAPGERTRGARRGRR